MTRLPLIEDRPGVVDGFRAEGLALVRTYEDRAGLACVRLASSGLLTVDLALPGQAGYPCVTALGGATSEIPILVVGGCDGWPSTLGLPSREFDGLMTIVRRCGRVTTDPERRYDLSVRTAGFLVSGAATLAEPGPYSDAWHATQLAIARDASVEHRAIA
jgi:hypothetical protein